MKIFQQSTAIILFYCITLFTVKDGFAFQAEAFNSQSPPQAAQQSTDQLEQLVAPIALYPDSLIAQILPAASFPEEIVDAKRFLDQHTDLKGDALAKEVDKQAWDPSVKALTQFPAVLGNMFQNLAWTSELGDVYVNQQKELTQAIQTMRARAKQAGNLNNTPQENVSTKGDTIAIQPADPEVVYVPQYDPWLAYGAPLAVFPGWYPYPGLFWDGPGIYWGLGFNVGLFAGFGWGWHSWGYDWHHGGRIFHDHHDYISHSRSIVNRNGFDRGRANFRGDAFRGRGSEGREGFRAAEPSRAPSGMRSGAFSGFDHGGAARTNSFRGQSSFGGFHGGGGGFRGGGGGSRGGGGHR